MPGVMVGACNPCDDGRGKMGGGRQIPGACKTASLAYQAKFQPMEGSVSEKGGGCLSLAETKVLLVRKGYLYTKSQQALKHLPTPTLPRPQQYLTTHGSKHTQKQAQNACHKVRGVGKGRQRQPNSKPAPTNTTYSLQLFHLAALKMSLEPGEMTQ